MPFTDITLVAPYILLKVQSSVAGAEDISAVASFAFGKLFQTASGSALVINTNYCLEGTNVKTLQIGGLAYYLAREDSIRFTETAS